VLACGGELAPTVVASTPAPFSSSVATNAPSATLASTEWSGKAADCEGIFIAPRRHCFKGGPLPAPARSPAPNKPHILILARHSSLNLTSRLSEQCIVAEEQTVLPVDGLELEVRLAPAAAPEVVRADERLGLELIACTARVVSESYGAVGTPKQITVIFFPGDIENKGRTRLDAATTPGIIVEFQHVDAPLTNASALRLLRVNAERLQACVETHKQKGRVSLVVELGFGRDGSARDVKVTDVEPKQAELAKCVQGVHYNLESTIYAEDGSTTLKLRYWLRGSPNLL
jgi:hypothetical protein